MKQFWGPEGRVGKGQWGRTGLGNLDPFAALLTGRDVREQSSAAGSGKGCQGWEGTTFFTLAACGKGFPSSPPTNTDNIWDLRELGRVQPSERGRNNLQCVQRRTSCLCSGSLLGKSFHLSLSPSPLLLAAPQT